MGLRAAWERARARERERAGEPLVTTSTLTSSTACCLRCNRNTSLGLRGNWRGGTDLIGILTILINVTNGYETDEVTLN